MKFKNAKPSKVRAVKRERGLFDKSYKVPARSYKPPPKSGKVAVAGYYRKK